MTQPSQVVPTRSRASIAGGRNVAAKVGDTADTREITPLGTAVANPTALTAQATKNQSAEIMNAINTLSGGIRSAASAELFTSARTKGAQGAAAQAGKDEAEIQSAMFAEGTLDPRLPGMKPEDMSNDRHDELVTLMSQSLTDNDPSTTAATTMRAYIRNEAIATFPEEMPEDERALYLAEYEDKVVAAGLKWWAGYQSVQQDHIMDNMAIRLATMTSTELRGEGIRPDRGANGMLRVFDDDGLFDGLSREEQSSVVLKTGEYAISLNTLEGFDRADLMAEAMIKSGYQLEKAIALRDDSKAARQKFVVEGLRTELGGLTNEALDADDDEAVAAALGKLNIALTAIGDDSTGVGNVVESVRAWMLSPENTLTFENRQITFDRVLDAMPPDSEAYRQLELARPSLDAAEDARRQRQANMQADHEEAVAKAALAILQNEDDNWEGYEVPGSGKKFKTLGELETHYDNHKRGPESVDLIRKIARRPQYTEQSEENRQLYADLLGEIRYGGIPRNLEDGEPLENTQKSVAENQRKGVMRRATIAFVSGDISASQYADIRNAKRQDDSFAGEKEASDFTRKRNSVLRTLYSTAGAKTVVDEDVLIENNWFFTEGEHEGFREALENIEFEMTEAWYTWLETARVGGMEHDGKEWINLEADGQLLIDLKADNPTLYARERRKFLNQLTRHYIGQARQIGLRTKDKQQIWDAETQQLVFDNQPVANEESQ